jgi:hypothetical protein
LEGHYRELYGTGLNARFTLCKVAVGQGTSRTGLKGRFPASFERARLPPHHKIYQSTCRFIRYVTNGTFPAWPPER